METQGCLTYEEWSSAPCSAHEIHHLNKHKEYTLTATYLLETVLTDRRLRAQAAMLWQLLFNKARFKDDLSVRLSVKTLSVIMRKSERTIWRYIEDLMMYGYLDIKNNFDDKTGSKLTNTFFVRFPEDGIKTAHQREDRRDAYNRRPPEPESVDDIREPINDTNVPRETLPAASEKTNSHKNQRSNNFQNNSSKQKLPKTPPVSTESISEQEQKLEAMKNKAEEISQQLAKTEAERQAACHEPKQYYGLTQQVGQLEGQLQALDGKREHLQRQHQAQQQKHHIEKRSTEEGALIQEIDGDRPIDTIDLQWLSQQLGAITNHPTTLNRLLNEITYSVRFGHLKVRKRDNQPMPIRQGFQIALKLVKSKQWTTPIDFECFLIENSQLN